MCDPVSMAVVMGLQAAGSVQGQMVQARTQKKIFERTSKSARQAAWMNRVQLGEQVRQEQAKVAKEMDIGSREAMRAGATASVSAGESGVGGASVGVLMDNYSRKRLEFETAKSIDLRNIETNALFKDDAIEAQAMNRITAATPTVASPNLIGSLLTIGGAALGGYAQGSAIENAGVE